MPVAPAARLSHDRLGGDVTQTVRLALLGTGHVGAAFLRLLRDRAARIEQTHQVRLLLVGVADEHGAAVAGAGLDVAAVAAVAGRGGSPAELGHGTAHDATEMLAESGPDLLLEATPLDLDTGEPAMSTVRSALGAGRHVVLANKGPVALDYPGLAQVADTGDCLRRDRSRPQLRFSATVAGALPVVNIGRRDLAGLLITKVQAVLNGTSHHVLRAMEEGERFDSALADAQRRGIAEHDASHDVGGLDAAAKLAIVANAVLGQPTVLADVEVQGIAGVGAGCLAAAAARGERVVPLAAASWDGERYRLSVAPTDLPLEHPLCQLSAEEMGVVFEAEGIDRIAARSFEPTADPAAAAMLRDVLEIARSTS